MLKPESSKESSNSWRRRDHLAAALLFLGSIGFVVWQNARVAVLWDLGYLLDTSWRIALGQVPYRDFPLAHAPLTFVIQAGLIRFGGRHYFLVVAYAALADGLATVLTWRILLRVLRAANVLGPASWMVSVLLAAPLTVLGIYSIYPHPIYDCDCTLLILIAIYLLSRLPGRAFSRTENAPELPSYFATRILSKECHPERSVALRRGVEGSAVAFLIRILERIPITAVAAGAATVLPLFLKQNMGLPFLAVIVAGMLLLLSIRLLRTHSLRVALLSPSAFVLAGIALALLAAIGIIAATAGLGNYIHWTVQFAAQRRLPGMASMLAVYEQPSFAWTLPTFAVGLILCHTRWMTRGWARVAAFCLMAAPFAGSLIFLLIDDDADERADNLLALWPLLLLATLLVALFESRHGLTLRRLIPFFVLAAIHGTFLSQQLWGSTYALWPLLMVLAACLLAALPAAARPVAIASAAVMGAVFLLCGTLYSASL